MQLPLEVGLYFVEVVVTLRARCQENVRTVAAVTFVIVVESYPARLLPHHPQIVFEDQVNGLCFTLTNRRKISGCLSWSRGSLYTFARSFLSHFSLCKFLFSGEAGSKFALIEKCS